jgi:hypothetical protein
MTPDFEPPPTWATLGIYIFMLATCIIFWVLFFVFMYRFFH